MKKAILIAIPLVLLVLVVLLYTLVPSIYQTWFILRHVSIYMLGAYILISSSYFVYKKLLRDFNIGNIRLWIIRSFSVILVVSLLLVGGDVQLNYIEDYEIPPLKGCAYYDKYDNLIYSSQFSFVCPELEGLEYETVDGKEVLRFYVVEEASGEMSPVYLLNTFYVESIMYNTFEYHYEEGSSRFERIEITSKLETDKTGDYNYEHSLYVRLYRKVIVNTFEGYITNPGEKEFIATSTITTQLYEHTYTGVGILDYFTPDFDDIEAETITYKAKYTENEDEGFAWNDDLILMFNYTIEISEEYIENNELVVNIFGEGERSNFNNSITLDGGLDGDRYVEYITHAYRNKASSAHDLPDYSSSFVSGELTRDGTFEYQGDGFYDTKYLQSYTRLVDNHEMMMEIEIEYYENNGDLYAINHFYTTKIIETDYGKKLEYYNTYRRSDNTYVDIKNNGDVYDILEFNFPYSLSLDQMHDYKFMMYDYTYAENLLIYQKNYLLHGVVTPTFELY